ncbi:uncharacterized protein C5orf34 homolog isoform X2 [Heterodontus francisci]|uniref:uncharacterized protein C5orf34 homolog isoform X2 n=1 Tax=Heterodontus francisci TaxID=7792 RepID=UPI00355B257D
MALVSLMILYEDDSVEVQFIDGSSLQLSPCGSEFLFEKAPAPSMHPLQSSCRVRQRTQFVISSYKEQLLQALGFRNRFASRLYLPADLIAADKLSNLLLDISEVKWPEVVGESAAKIADNGQVTVSSLGGHAFLYLAPSQLEFTVQFQVRVSQSAASKPLIKPGPEWSGGPQQTVCLSRDKVKPVGFGAGQNSSWRRAPSWQSEAEGAADPRVTELRSGGLTEICSKYVYQYTWVVQHHTVSSCPPEWQYPLRLALHHNREQEKSLGPDGTDNGPRSTDETVTPGVAAMPGTATALPRALPLNCPAPHLHRWRYRDVLGQGNLDLETCLYFQQVKVVWCQGVVYRVIAETVSSVEIYPGDGSVLKSHDVSSNYFTHYLMGQSDGQREERVYMVSSLPPDTPSSKYSICSMVTLAVRILQCYNQLKLSRKLPNVCCWKKELSQPGASDQLPILLEEQMVWNVGKFSAFSDGRVHISFCNGVRLYTSWDFESRHRGEWKSVRSPVIFSETQTDVMPGWCQLLFPDGSSQLVPMCSAGIYEGYATPAISWCRWVSEGGQERTSMECPNPRARGQDESRSVIAELQKIQRFNCLLENSNCLKRGLPSHANPDLHQPAETPDLYHGAGDQSVETALRQTGRTIQDIELLLEANNRGGK